MAADASIVFDTALDPTGFERGVESIGDKMARMKQTLIDVASASESAFDAKVQKGIDSLTQKLDRQIEQMNKAKNEASKLKRQYDELASGEVEPKSVQNMTKELQKTNVEIEKELVNNERVLAQYKEAADALDVLENKKSVFASIGDEVYTSVDKVKEVYNSLDTELEQSANKLDELNAKSQNLSDSISAIKINPELSSEAQDVAEALGQASIKTERLANEAERTEQSIKDALDEEIPIRWTAAVDNGNKSAKRMVRSVREVGKSAKSTINPLEKMLKSIKRMVVATFFFQIFRKGIREIRNYITSLMRTNEEYVNSLNSIKVNLMVAFQPIFTHIMPAINTFLSAIAKATAYMAQFISMLFGTSYEASKAAAKATNEQADALKNVGKSAKDARKQLQGFDQLNRQQDDSSGGGGGGASGAAGLFDAPSPELDPVWIKKFADAIDGIKKAAEPTITALKRLWEEGLKPLMGFVWQGLKDFWTYFLVPVGEWLLGEGLPRFVDAITDQLAMVDWDRLNGALIDLWNALAPFAIQIGEGLLWFWEEVITPFIGWALNNLIPAAIDMITAAIEFLSTVIDIAMPVLIWFWETFLVPIRDYLWDSIIKLIEGFTKAFEKFSEWAKKNPKAVETMAKVLLGFLAGLWVYNTSKKLIDFLITLGQRFVLFAGQLGTMIIAALPALALTALVAAIVLIGSVWDKLSPAQRVITILSGLAAAAIAAAIAIAVFHASWSVGIAAAIIIGSIVAIGVAFASLKSKAGESWNVSTPKIDPFGSAGNGNADSFFSTVSGGSPLPGLAQGGLIPPRKPRPVIVGDNQYEDEIISPRSAIREEVKNAIKELGGGLGDSQAIDLLMRILRAIESGHTIELDQRELGRTIIRTIRSVQNQTGDIQIQTVR